MELQYVVSSEAGVSRPSARTGKGSIERRLYGGNNHVLKVHWQEQLRDVRDWCESQTPLLMEEDVAFLECLESDKIFNFQY